MFTRAKEVTGLEENFSIEFFFVRTYNYLDFKILTHVVTLFNATKTTAAKQNVKESLF